MPMTCSVLGCTARFQNKDLNPLRTFHSFPKDEVLRQAWLKAIQREDFVPTKYSRLCSDHFREESFDRTSLHYVRLRDGAVPSIFNTVQESLKRKNRQIKKRPKKHEKKQMEKMPKKCDVKVRPRRTTGGSSCHTGETPQQRGLKRDEPETQCSWRKQKCTKIIEDSSVECMKKPYIPEVYIKEEPIDENRLETIPHIGNTRSDRKQKSSTLDKVELTSSPKVKNPIGMKMNKNSFEASDHGSVEYTMEAPCILEEVYIKEEPVDQSGLETRPLLRNAESCRRKLPVLDKIGFTSSHEVKEEPLSMENDEDRFGATYVKEPFIKEELVIKEEPVDENNVESSPLLRTTESFTSDGGHPESSQKCQSVSSDTLHPWARGSATAPDVRCQTSASSPLGSIDGEANHAIIPPQRSSTHVQDVWMGRKYGQLKSVEAIKYYASISKDATIEMKTNGDHFCVVLITPFMKRAHRELREAGEVVFTETIGCADQRNAILLPLLCAGPAGAAPLAILFMSSREKSSFIKGFGMIKSLLGDSAFFGRGTPRVFITDNCEAKRNAIASMWPEAQCFLNIFHVMRQVWSWLVDPKHNVGKTQRLEFMDIFKELVYAKSTEDFSSKWDASQNYLAKKYPEFGWYIESLIKKKSEWSITFQGGEILRGHYANNFCKATMYIIKEIVRSRCKSYSTAQLIMYMVEIFDVYIQNRFMDVALRQRRLQALIVSKLPMDAVYPLGNGKYRVQNPLDSEELNEVDLIVGTCTCIQGESGAICMHQVTCAEFNMTVIPQKFESHFEYREWLAALAVGKGKAADLIGKLFMSRT